MTDGAPYGGSTSELSRAILRTVNFANSKKVTIFPIGVGKEADMDVLK